jgi:DNA-binding MarR family transcriptional regulator
MLAVAMKRQAGKLRQEIRQDAPFASSEEEVFLNLQRSAHLLARAFGAVLDTSELTLPQYNVLRILRGSHPRVLTCGEIAERLVTPGPDVTRLLDRLERRGLAERARDPADRRVVRVGVTAAGLELLAGLDQPVAVWLRDHLEHLEPDEQATLVRLLEKARRTAVTA